MLTTMDTSSVGEVVSPFLLPCNFIITGQTGAGKTELVKKMLFHIDKLFLPPPDRIIYVYTLYQPIFDEMERQLGSKITFRNDIPTGEELKEHYQETKESSLVILDDKLSSLDSSKSGKNLVELTTVIARHCKISLMFLLQNLYHNSSSAREIALNCQVNIIFRNDRSASQITRLASQIMPGNIPYFRHSYELATARPYGYLVIDLSPNIDKKFRLKSNIIPGDDLRIYLPNNAAH